ncbi:hypothetical protein MOQ_006526, partial [Trypanosoma cruzi marinkellei]
MWAKGRLVHEGALRRELREVRRRTTIPGAETVVKPRWLRTVAFYFHLCPGGPQEMLFYCRCCCGMRRRNGWLCARGGGARFLIISRAIREQTNSTTPEERLASLVGGGACCASTREEVSVRFLAPVCCVLSYWNLLRRWPMLTVALSARPLLSTWGSFFPRGTNCQGHTKETKSSGLLHLSHVALRVGFWDRVNHCCWSSKAGMGLLQSPRNYFYGFRSGVVVPLNSAEYLSVIQNPGGWVASGSYTAVRAQNDEAHPPFCAFHLPLLLHPSCVSAVLLLLLLLL